MALDDVRQLLDPWFAFWMPNKSSTERAELLSCPRLLQIGLEALEQCGLVNCTVDGCWDLEWLRQDGRWQQPHGHWLSLLVQSLVREQLGALLVVSIGLLQLCGPIPTEVWHSALSTVTALLNNAPTSVVCAFPDLRLHISSRCLHAHILSVTAH